MEAVSCQFVCHCAIYHAAAASSDTSGSWGDACRQLALSRLLQKW